MESEPTSAPKRETFCQRSEPNFSKYLDCFGIYLSFRIDASWILNVANLRQSGPVKYMRAEYLSVRKFALNDPGLFPNIKSFAISQLESKLL
jgi:hypothetical protein